MNNHTITFDDVLAFLATKLPTTRREIRIFYSTENDAILRDKAIIKLLSATVRANRHCQARIICSDANSMAASNHPLLSLSQRIPSLIKIREHKEPALRFEEQYLLLDRQHFAAWQTEGDCNIGEDAPARCKDRLLYFDQLWEQCQEHPALRSLLL